jgi:predicted  nucleic acid-binding Zn-ribbon protein
MTYNQDMILFLQHRVQAMEKEMTTLREQLNKANERCEYLESEKEHLLNQLLDKPYLRLRNELSTGL